VWNLAANWSDDTLPVSGDTVIIPQGYIVDLDTPTVPSTGRFVELRFTGDGQLLIDDTAGGAVNLSATNINFHGAAAAAIEVSLGSLKADVTLHGHLTTELTGTGSGVEIMNGSSETLTINGDVVCTTDGGTADYMIHMNSIATAVNITINGDLSGCTGTSTSSPGIYIQHVGAIGVDIIVTGTVKGGTGTANAAIRSANAYDLDAGTVAYVGGNSMVFHNYFPTLTVDNITIDGTAFGTPATYRRGDRDFD
jgi:hypothetical protein